MKIYKVRVTYEQVFEADNAQCAEEMCGEEFFYSYPENTEDIMKNSKAKVTKITRKEFNKFKANRIV